MAVLTTSAPQQGVKLPAVDLRQLVGVDIASEGVRVSTDLAVSQRGAGANMSVDVAAGSCAIQDDHATGGGFYSYTTAAVTNVAIGAADPTNPRVDRVVVRVRDLTLGDATNAIDIFVVAGTPTVGATLANCTGAAAVPGSCLLLANVLVPAAAASILTANIDTTGASNNSPKVRPLLASVGSGLTNYRKTTAKTVNTSIVETDLLNGEITIAAGVLGTTGAFRLTLIGLDHLNNSGGNVTFRWKLKLGATTVFDTGLLTVGTGANRGSIFFTALCENTAAAAQIWTGFVSGLISGASLIPANALTSGQSGVISSTVSPMPWQSTSAVDTSVAQALTFTVTMGTSAALAEAKLLGAIVEIF